MSKSSVLESFSPVHMKMLKQWTYSKITSPESFRFLMLHETIRNDDFQRLGLGLGSQHCCDIVLSSDNTVPTLQRCVALEIVVANRPV